MYPDCFPKKNLHGVGVRPPPAAVLALSPLVV
jgi:hypothetical protein